MKKVTDITILLDRSGSMQSIKEGTIQGFNSFLKEQQECKGKAFLTLDQFNHGYQTSFEAIDIKDVQLLNSESYNPDGLTALLDAIGKTIEKTCLRIKSLDKKQRPDQIIMVIITDGFENNSTIYNRKKIFKLIQKMEDKKKWQFVFLGANQDAIQEAHRYNISEKKAMTFAADDIGINDAFQSISHNICYCRVIDKDFEFTEDEKEKQERD